MEVELTLNWSAVLREIYLVLSSVEAFVVGDHLLLSAKYAKPKTAYTLPHHMRD